VSESDILNSIENDQIRALLDFQIERAESFYDRAFKQLPNEDKKGQRTGLMMAAIYRTLLREIKADNPTQVLNARISLPPLRKFWLAFRTFIKY
jgi:phytoene synthase